MTSSEFQALTFIWALSSAALVVLFVIGVILYLLSAIGLYKMAENAGIEYGWLAFIPVLNLYIVGRVVGDFKIGDFMVTKVELILPLGSIVVSAIGGVPVIGTLISLVYLAFSMAVMYQLIKLYDPHGYLIKFIVSIVLPFTFPVFIFLLRNNRKL